MRSKHPTQRRLDFSGEPIREFQRKGMDPTIMIESKSFGLKTIAWLLLVAGLALAGSCMAIIVATTGLHNFALVSQMATLAHLTARVFLAIAVACLVGAGALIYSSITSFMDSSELDQEIASRDELSLYSPKR